MNEMEIRKTFSANVRAERARANYTQEQLAELVGVSTEYISRIEHAKVNPTIMVVAKIAIALGITLDTLLPVKH